MSVANVSSPTASPKRFGKIVNKRELISIIGWSNPKLDRALLIDPNFPIISSGGAGEGYQFNADEVLKYISKTKAPPGEQSSAHTRKTLAEAELREMQVAQLKKELIPAEDIADVLADTMIRLGAFLDSVPTRLRSEFHLPDEVTRKIADWFDAERQRLVKQLEEIVTHET